MIDNINQAESFMQNPRNPVPLVSICIPVFNGEKTIRKTISSIINQTYDNIEIIIVDNCSSDSTVEIIKEFKDPRIRLIQNDVFVTCNGNFNRCFQYVNGEFMAFFHADDVYFPQIVSRQIETFEKYPTVGSVFTLGNIIDENDEIVGKFSLPQGIKGSTLYGYRDILISSLENYNFLPCPTAMLRTSLYLKLSPFRADPFASASDFDMFLRAAKCAPIIILDEKLINYRVSKTHGTYLLDLGRTHEADFFKVMDFHIAQYQELAEISPKVMNKYNITRLGDQLTCIRNALDKRDFKEFENQIKNVQWIKNCKILINNPELINLKFLKTIILKKSI